MILPVYLYGEPVLRKLAEEIDIDTFDYKTLVSDMFETMYHAGGVGLAGPQIGQAIRLFVIDSEPFKESFPDVQIYKGAFINPIVLEEWGDDFVFSEGCLSIPQISENVTRKSQLRIEYYDETGVLREQEFSGLVARIIQHEYEHLDGRMFIDNLPPIKKMVLKRQLADIASGKTKPAYKTPRKK